MMDIGLRRHTVRIVPHNPMWISLAKDTIRQLKAVSGDNVLDIQHVGSTSVPDLPAKPIIDIAVAVAGMGKISNLIDSYCGLGYLYRGDNGTEGGHLFVLEPEPNIRTVHIHVVRQDDSQWENYLQFRDTMRENAELRWQYRDLKEDLSHKFRTDRGSYTAGKDRFIRRVLRVHE